MGQGVGTDEVPARQEGRPWNGGHTSPVPGVLPPHSTRPDAGTASALYSHNVVGFQSRVWRGVDEHIGKGVLVMIVHLVCKAHSLGVTTALPGTALQGQGAGGATCPSFLVTCSQFLPALCRARPSEEQSAGSYLSEQLAWL